MLFKFSYQTILNLLSFKNKKAKWPFNKKTILFSLLKYIPFLKSNTILDWD